MASFDAFIGPSYTAQSVNVDCERSMNLYAEAVTGGGANGKSRVALYGTPGLTTLCTLPTSPVRGIWANQFRCFVVAGSKLYEISNTGSIIGLAGPTDHTTRGDVGSDGLPVQIFPNGSQLLIVSGGLAYCDNGAGPVLCSFPALGGNATGGTLKARNVPIYGYGLYYQITGTSGDDFTQSLLSQPITLTGATGGTNPNLVVQVIDSTHLLVAVNPGAGVSAWVSTPSVSAIAGGFLDGYFIVAPPYSKQINFSKLNDGTTWSQLDNGNKSAYPDNIVGILTDHEELWLLGSDTTEVWQDTGAALNPLSRMPGGFIERGCAATWSPVRLKDGVAWLSSDASRGGTVAVLARGFQPTVVSTPAVETAWAAYSTVADAVSMTYTERGHEFWLISFPTANATWCYDATMDWWHERGWWNGASLDRQRQAFHAYVFGAHIVGDWSNGNIYTQSLAAFDDAGTSIHRIRTAPHLSTEQLYSYYSRFQLDLELGQSTSTPTVNLSWSDDGGHTFSTPIAATPTTATFAAMIVWRRLGKSRDRVFSITITDAVKIALIRAILDVEQGTR